MSRISFDSALLGPWICQQVKGVHYPQRGSTIGLLNEQDEPIAGILYEDYNKANVMIHVASQGTWDSPEFLHIIFDYPFNQLGVKRITGPIASNNTRAIALAERFGLEYETKLVDAHPDGDILIYKMTRERCKELGFIT